MSRCGRATQALADWKDHPKGCTADHGFHDGYDGPCTDDPWDIANLLDDIDPMFRQDEIARLRRLVMILGGDDLLAYLDTMDGRRALDGEAITDPQFLRLLAGWKDRQQQPATPDQTGAAS